MSLLQKTRFNDKANDQTQLESKQNRTDKIEFQTCARGLHFRLARFLVFSAWPPRKRTSLCVLWSKFRVDNLKTVSMLLAICFVLSVTLFVVSLLLISFVQKPLPVKNGSRCLLLIAHPDDECMFFGPTLLNLVRNRCELYVLCISTGNADGLGSKRTSELVAACKQLGIPSQFLTIMNFDGLKDGDCKWETEKLSRIVLQHAERLDIEVIISFDGRGVSSHLNHIACFHALQFLYTNGHIPSGTQIFVLETVSIFRKYVGIFDVHCSYMSPTFMLCAAPWTVWLAMRKHRSQLVWFRYLYMIFSRYVMINTLKRISLHRLMVSKRGR
ncbi:N-acetylglucosaminylphosphatidylinositol deacetylase [Aphelenchoides besseyi]|nr:N-acetylglucosaminylphosphatidylinositol deacetylase [Aphelenchoides besseyi]KAI6208023.1 N-acetylglucosaminylphosphatidylinositol deacetylase [Aphelenchoides besseyi]